LLPEPIAVGWVLFIPLGSTAAAAAVAAAAAAAATAADDEDNPVDVDPAAPVRPPARGAAAAGPTIAQPGATSSAVSSSSSSDSDVPAASYFIALEATPLTAGIRPQTHIQIRRCAAQCEAAQCVALSSCCSVRSMLSYKL